MNQLTQAVATYGGKLGMLEYLRDVCPDVHKHLAPYPPARARRDRNRSADQLDQTTATSTLRT